MFARSIRIASIFAVTLAIIAAGCHTVPLGDPEKSTVDAKLNGWYLSEKPGTLVFFRPYDSRTYAVTYFGFEDPANPKPQTRLTNKAWLTNVGGMTVMTLEIIDAEWDFETPGSKAARYSYYRIRHTDGDGIEATPLNTDFLKETKTPQELEKKIADNVNNEELWKGSEPMSLKPVAENKMDDAKKIVAAFSPNK